MHPTPETLPTHELNGLPVRVVESTNPDLVGISGRVVIETTNTLHVADESDGRVRQVPKRGTTFEFELVADASEIGRARESTPVERDSTAIERDSASTERVSTPTECESRNTTDADDRRGGSIFVTVDGERLRSRPARRTETTGDSPWQ